MTTTHNIAGKTILLGVCGGIAAFKTCGILRGLQRKGAKVKVVMTEGATKFVGPLTFRALTNEAVAIDQFDGHFNDIHHVSLAEEADVFLIVPATANTIIKLANGIADNLLTTTALATKAPLVVCPAMNEDMWKNPKVQNAIATLESDGALVVSPDEGYLACGQTGTGRLADIDEIIDITIGELVSRSSLEGKKVMITSGPTFEAIDSVRYIGNRSSGKTGLALAIEAQRRGAEVVLITGPVSHPDPRGVRTVRVVSAVQMYEAAAAEFASSDIAIFAAAVSDFRAEKPSELKIKKEVGEFKNIALVENPDILRSLAEKKNGQFVVGFAAETGNATEHALKKLKSKNADLIVANDVSDPSMGFATDNNRVWIISGENEIIDTGIATKRQIASLIFNKITSP
jgi:phosphopantothenoylcysteine decarboxylase/phosphopantothenate--cysteine ligase